MYKKKRKYEGKKWKKGEILTVLGGEYNFIEKRGGAKISFFGQK